MEWTCDEDCWCHIPVQSQRGPPCYQCVLRNCSFSYPIPPEPSAPPLHTAHEPSAPPLFRPHEEASAPPLSTSPHLYQEQPAVPHLSSSAPPLPPPLRKRSSVTSRSKAEIQRCVTAPLRTSLNSHPSPPHAAAAVTHTQEFSLLSPANQASVELEDAVQPGWEEGLQRHSHARNVKRKSECTDLSALLRELLLDDEDVTFSTSNRDNEASSCVLREENTLRIGTRNSFFTTNSNIHQHSNGTNFSNNSLERRMKEHGRVSASDRIGVRGRFLSQRQSIHAMTLGGSLDEETFTRINKINRRESWKRAEQRHMLDSG